MQIKQIRFFTKKIGKKNTYKKFLDDFLKYFDIYMEENHIFLKYVQFQVDPSISWRKSWFWEKGVYGRLKSTILSKKKTITTFCLDQDSLFIREKKNPLSSFMDSLRRKTKSFHSFVSPLNAFFRNMMLLYDRHDNS